ncbi:MAG: aquaporin family protein [Deltaproteobacteria bacterium]|nr:aquaporin family protein [Deltaproteobacteria bacterium]
MLNVRDFTGEYIGTFLLVFFGCGSVAVTILFSAHTGLFQVAAVWGIGVALAIYATRHLSCAHLNPAVSIAMVVGGRMAPAKLPGYLTGQFLGAFCAAAVLYALLSPSIALYESLHGIVRGTPASIQTAMMFGEFYPNPGSGAAAAVSTMTAFFAEGVGTFALVFLVFALTEGCNIGRPDDSLAPLFIGLTVTAIISVLSPLTQAGLNPARDLAPRLFSMLAGWGKAALPDNHFGFLTVYVLGPIVGAVLAALLFTKIIEPLMNDKRNNGCC